jgi:hypothetical protein
MNDEPRTENREVIPDVLILRSRFGSPFIICLFAFPARTAPQRKAAAGSPRRPAAKIGPFRVSQAGVRRDLSRFEICCGRRTPIPRHRRLASVLLVVQASRLHGCNPDTYRLSRRTSFQLAAGLTLCRMDRRLGEPWGVSPRLTSSISLPPHSRALNELGTIAVPRNPPRLPAVKTEPGLQEPCVE